MAQPQVLPKELRLTAAPTMPQARSYLFKQKSTISEYNTSESIQINIPRLQRTYLTKDSYLKFNVELNLGTGGFGWKTDQPALSVVLDRCGAYGLFERIEIYDYLGSTLLESISGHGALMTLLLDTSHGFDEATTRDNATMGISAAVTANDSSVGIPYANTGHKKLISSFCGGAILPSPLPTQTQAGWTAATTATREFAIPLASFLGLFSDKFVPLHNGFTIRLTLASFDQAFGIHSVTTPTVDHGSIELKMNEVYYCAQALELGPVAESMLLSSTAGQPMIVPSRTYRNFNGIIDQDASSARLDLNPNVASMTSLLWMMRDNSLYTNPSKSSYGDRIRNMLQSWNFQYGSSILPQTSGVQAYGSRGNKSAGSGYTEAYIELMKARRNWSGMKTYTGSNISGESYSKDIASILDMSPHMLVDSSYVDEPGKFAAGLNLELVAGKDIICGLNTNGMNTSINMTFRDDLTTKAVQSRVDAWCEYDSFINITPGLATTVSF